MQIKSTLIGLTAVAGAALAQMNSFSVASPQSLQQCVPYQINITGGTPPFNIRITEPGQVGQIIENLPTTESRTVTWTCNIEAGRMITIAVTDSTGSTAASAPSNAVNENDDESCLGQPASVSGGGAGGSSGGSTSGGAQPTSASGGDDNDNENDNDNEDSNTSAAGGGMTSSMTASGPSNTGSSGSSSSNEDASNGAGSLSAASAAVAGIVGAAVAALL